MCDVDGLLTTTRKDGNLEGHKSFYAKDHKPMKNLREIVQELKPSVSVPVLHCGLSNTIRIYIYVDTHWCISNTRPIYTRNFTRHGIV